MCWRRSRFGKRLTYASNSAPNTKHIHRVGQDHIYIRCIYGKFGREITKYTFIYGAYIRFWPTLHVHPQTHLASNVSDATNAVQQESYKCKQIPYLRHAQLLNKTSITTMSLRITHLTSLLQTRIWPKPSWKAKCQLTQGNFRGFCMIRQHVMLQRSHVLPPFGP